MQRLRERQLSVTQRNISGDTLSRATGLPRSAAAPCLLASERASERVPLVSQWKSHRVRAIGKDRYVDRLTSPYNLQNFEQIAARPALAMWFRKRNKPLQNTHRSWSNAIGVVD